MSERSAGTGLERALESASTGADAASGGAVDFVTKNGPFTGRMRWAEALLAVCFGVGGAVLAASLLAALRFAHDHGQLGAAAAVTIVWTAGLGVVVGAWAARLRSLSVTDPLTGLFNRRFLARHMARELQRQRRGSRPGALLFADLDRLKPLNDRFGHLAGDAAIVAVAESIAGCVRSRDLVARVGGDEFNVVLIDTSVAEAQQIARRIGEALALRRGPWPEPLTLSIGVAALCADVTRVADAALYEAKRSGAGSIVAAGCEAT